MSADVTVYSVTGVDSTGGQAKVIVELFHAISHEQAARQFIQKYPLHDVVATVSMSQVEALLNSMKKFSAEHKRG